MFSTSSPHRCHTSNPHKTRVVPSTPTVIERFNLGLHRVACVASCWSLLGLLFGMWGRGVAPLDRTIADRWPGYADNAARSDAVVLLPPRWQRAELPHRGGAGVCGVAAILVSLIVGLGLIRVLPELAGDAHDLIVNVVRVVTMTGLAFIMIYSRDSHFWRYFMYHVC